jgi:SAM-dependent methyltransferase
MPGIHSVRLAHSGVMTGERRYGDVWAPYYDEVYTEVDLNAIRMLEEYAGPERRMLELGIGTGRMALPLVHRGIDVVGVDESEAMVARLRSKPGGDRVSVVIGDFADVPVEGTFPLVYLGFNTLFCLLTQERQVDCFVGVAEHLDPGGRLVLECFVPDLVRYDGLGTRVGVGSLSPDGSHSYELAVHHAATQVIEAHNVRRLATGETVVLPTTIRYAWPSEIDLMARIAGLELEARWDWYDRRPFTDRSPAHVSVYRKP